MFRPAKLVLSCLVVAVCSSVAFSQTEIKIKLVDGSSLAVDEATETPQGVWYRKGNINQLLPKEKVKKIEQTSQAPQPAPVQSTNDDDHFEVAGVVAEKPTSGTYDQPVWIYLKGGARVEADSASESPAGVWYKRGSMSMFL